MIEVFLKKLNNYDVAFSLPRYESLLAAGADIRACLKDIGEIIIAPGERVLVPTGLAVEIPIGYEIQVRPRSGLSFKTGLSVLNSPGTIDADYRGEIKIILGNLGTITEKICHGDRIAQLVLAPVIQATFLFKDVLDSTDRGVRGFGSTGVK